MKLDKSKPYGEVINDSQGRRYEQGGRYFDATGNEIVDKSKVVKTKPVLFDQASASASASSATPNDDQIAAQLGG